MKKRGIGNLNESSLHKALKEYYAPGYNVEETVKGFVVDLKKDKKIIEIQTGNFSSLKKKFKLLLPDYKIHLVYPIPKEKRLIRLDSDGEILSKRLSPKKGCWADIFSELVYITDFLLDPNLSIEILLTKEEEIRVEDGRGSWRRKGVSIKDHHLVEILSRYFLKNATDYLSFLPANLGNTFTNKELANLGFYSLNKAQKITYTLKKAGLITVDKKVGSQYYYQILGGEETKSEIS